MTVIRNKDISWDFWDYREYYLVNCIVSGDFNNIWRMVWWKVTWDFNLVALADHTNDLWDFNTIWFPGNTDVWESRLYKTLFDVKYWVKTFWDYQKNIQEKEPREMTPIEFWLFFYLRMLCNIPESVLEALDITQDAMQSTEQIIENTIRIKKRENEYFKKHWSWIEKWKSYLQSFYLWKK